MKFKNLKTELEEVVKNLKNVTLEVKEISKPNTPPLKIQNDSFRENKKVNEEPKVKLATLSNLNYFSNLASSSEDEPDPETDKEDDEDDDDEDDEDDEDAEDEDE